MAANAGTDGGAVLVVDDEPQIRAICCQALERAGYQVATAADGVEALRALTRTAFDAAVLDIVLPDTSGLELLRAIRERHPGTVVVLITGFASLDSAMEAVRLGAYEYLRKPFRASDLARIVARGIEGRRLRGRNDELLAELRRANEELLARQHQLREHARLETGDLAAFVELGRRLSAATGLAETLQHILAAGIAVTRAKAAAIYRIDPTQGALRGVAAIGLPVREVAEARIAPDEGLLGRAAARGLALIENRVLGAEAVGDRYLSFLGVESALVMPLAWDDEVCGVMALFDQQDGAFAEQSMNLVRVLAGQAARVVAALPAHTVAEEPSPSEFVDLADLL